MSKVITLADLFNPQPKHKPVKVGNVLKSTMHENAFRIIGERNMPHVRLLNMGEWLTSSPGWFTVGNMDALTEDEVRIVCAATHNEEVWAAWHTCPGAIPLTDIYADAKPMPKLKVGDKVRRGNHVLVLAATDRERVKAILIHDGSRWGDGDICDTTIDIQRAEAENIFAGHPLSDWQYLGSTKETEILSGFSTPSWIKKGDIILCQEPPQ